MCYAMGEITSGRKMKMKERVMAALRALPTENLSDMAWQMVGVALKKEGLPCAAWRDWFRNDERWRPGLCEELWESFDGNDVGNAETVLRLARLLGRLPPEDAYDDLLRDCDRDGLPVPVSLGNFREKSPELPDELIRGILRRGHKMLLSGCSKAGKSFLMMELCVAISEGLSWLGFPCRKGRVMYVNLEIDPASVVHRFKAIYSALGIEPRHMEDIALWNLRGHALPMDQLTWPLVRRLKEVPFDAVVIDPIYKVLTGDENSAGDMTAFCNQFDRICAAAGCSVIYCHHHSKGAQALKKASDRASGSGVFARDPDAQLDVLQLEVTEQLRKHAAPGATAWRLETNLREFPNVPPVHFWYEYPLHRPDIEGVLDDAQPCVGAGTSEAPRRSTPATRAKLLREAFNTCAVGVTAPLSDLARQCGVSLRAMKDWVRENGDAFLLEGDTVRRLPPVLREG